MRKCVPVVSQLLLRKCCTRSHCCEDKRGPYEDKERRKSKRCSNCKISGHVITTCPSLVPPEDDEVNINDEDYGPESQSLRRDATQMENHSSTDKRTFQKKKMKSLSQISDTQEEGKHIPTECKANEVLNGPHKVGGENCSYQLPIVGPSSVGNIQIREGMSITLPYPNSSHVPVLPSQGSSMHHGLFPLFPNQSTIGLNLSSVHGTEDGSRPGVWNDLLQEVIRKSVGPGENTGKNE
ncbi:hypothetical protein SESBI_19944 [Sesbania bispinosa]|nr:hypothetical protein SESBI_19944 [Sesbania bispinosa]